MKKKLILFDVDGTLISYDGILPQSTIHSIRQARQNGHLCFIVTGRSKGHVSKKILDIGFDGMICGNGSYIEVNGTILKDMTFSLEETKNFVDYLESHDLSFYMECDRCVYGSKDFETRAIPAYKAYGCKEPIVIKELYPDMEFPTNLIQPHISKINYILSSYQDYLDFKQTFPSYRCMTWGGIGEKAIFGDVTLIIDKATSIQELANYLHIETKDIVSFGDAEVDISMFEVSGLSISFQGAKKAAQEAAHYVTDAVVEDGIQKALMHFHLI